MRRATPLLLFLLFLGTAMPAAAEEPPFRFRPTTPRATLTAADGALVLGVPAGRAWGVTSELRPLPPPGSAMTVTLAVDDPDVREAFVRVAYYAEGRARQIAVADSLAVTAGERLLVLALDPPPASSAYRVRVLARLRRGADVSKPDAVRARATTPAPDQTRETLLTRLLPDGP